MLDTDSSRAKRLLGVVWLVFASVNIYLTFALAGAETIPYHLVWASFALLYGLFAWSRWLTWSMFALISVLTGIAFFMHASSHAIAWTENSEIILMGVILALLVWHVDRHRAMQRRLVMMQEDERRRAHHREMASRFGSHEVRTRLTIARGFVELMAATTCEPEVRKDAALVLGELDRASVLVTDLLTLVSVSEPSRPALVEVDRLIESVVHRWVGTADRDWSWSSPKATVLGDRERLEAALDCLLENAVKFTEVGDVIAVDARLEHASMVMTVRDSGVGMPAEDVAGVFEIFRTASSAGDRAGSGLGLSIVRAVAAEHRGTAHLTSTPGGGTLVTLRITPAQLTPSGPGARAGLRTGRSASEPVPDGEHALLDR